MSASERRCVQPRAVVVHLGCFFEFSFAFQVITQLFRAVLKVLNILINADDDKHVWAIVDPRSAEHVADIRKAFSSAIIR